MEWKNVEGFASVRSFFEFVIKNCVVCTCLECLNLYHIHREYGNIFKYGNRNAASHLWSSFLLDRAWNFDQGKVSLFQCFTLHHQHQLNTRYHALDVLVFLCGLGISGKCFI